ncbi:hypothetical protein DERF_009868 [Dermatophagoides farinae]|uniref:Uncharacterized protein n=1 Tax=Dermatophagoides farinae TaxID=6954 RepID=A0A922L673_DERFA|nr:hypothetical protein DERF_009868 [Dermatophagoides farinae]
MSERLPHLSPNGLLRCRIRSWPIWQYLEQRIGRRGDANANGLSEHRACLRTPSNTTTKPASTNHVPTTNGINVVNQMTKSWTPQQMQRQLGGGYMNSGSNDMTKTNRYR